MIDKLDRKGPSRDVRDSVAKELAMPRMAKSARIARLKQDTKRTSAPPSVSMTGIVNKIILPPNTHQPEHAQIAVDGADPGHRDLRIENVLIDEHGDDVTLEIGEPVEVTITPHATMQAGQPYDIMIDKLITERAYERWERRGRPIGSPKVDWDRAMDDFRREQERHGLRKT